MNQDYHIPLSSWAKRLETVSGDEFRLVLNNIRLPVYIDDSIVKNELGLLNTKIIKLVRSNDMYHTWKGCHTAVIICNYNPLMLVTYGDQLLTAVYNRLEQHTNHWETKVIDEQFKTLTVTMLNTLSILIKLIRGKPTLSRECLVPKLKFIIPLLISLVNVETSLVLNILMDILYNHPTTFKPFINKYRTALLDLFNNGFYDKCDTVLKKNICDNFAYLHLLKSSNTTNGNVDENEQHHKSSQDETWKFGINSILVDFKPIIEIFNDILDLDQDKSIVESIQNLPTNHTNDDNSNLKFFLTPLKIDLNDSFTLWQIPKRLDLLINLLTSFISLRTPYPVRIPIGTIHKIAELLMNINLKYVTIKREIRHDQELATVIKIILPEVQSLSIKMWSMLIDNVGKNIMTDIPDIIASIEFFIPLRKKSTDIDLVECLRLKNKFESIFTLINKLLRYMGHHFNEINAIVKLINIALFLTEDQSLLDSFTRKDKENNTLKNSTNGKKKLTKKDNKLGSMSDVYTHYQNFTIRTDLNWFNITNKFFYNIICNWKLPSSEQIRITRYCIINAMRFKKETGTIPQSFIKLLRIIVINPGFERVSILPIAVSILKEMGDDVFEIMCHPRLPMGIIHDIKNIGLLNSVENVSFEENQINLDHLTEQDQEIEQTTEQEEKVEEQDEEDKVEIVHDSTLEQIDEKLILKKRTIETTTSNETSKRVKINQKVEEITFNEDEPVREITIEETITKIEQNEDEDEDEDEDDEEFVIPEIELSDDEDDDE